MFYKEDLSFLAPFGEEIQILDYWKTLEKKRKKPSKKLSLSPYNSHGFVLGLYKTVRE